MAAIKVTALALMLAAAPLAAQQDTTMQQDSSAEAAIPAVTLDQAITMATRNQPSVITAEGNVDVAHASQREAFGNYLPTISASTGFSHNSSGSRFDPTTQTTVTSVSNSYNGGLNARLTLFDGFAREAQSRVASAGAVSADAALVAQKFQVALQTKQAFFNALAADELIRSAQAQIKQAQEQHQVAKDKLMAGSATRADTLTTTVQLANARLALVNAETQRETARATLARLMGLDHEVRAQADSSLYATPQIDTLQLRQDAIASSPSVQQAEASLRTAKAQVAVSRAQYFPSLSAGYSQSLGGPDLSTLRHSWSLSLSLSWSLFNGFTRETNMARNGAARDEAEATLADTKRQASANLTTQLTALRSAEQRIDIAKASGAAAEENLRVQQTRYRVGASTIVDVQTAETSVVQAASDLVRARLDFLVAKAQIEAIVGHEL